jgi:hypothetical protein
LPTTSSEWLRGECKHRRGAAHLIAIGDCANGNG